MASLDNELIITLYKLNRTLEQCGYYWDIATLERMRIGLLGAIKMGNIKTKRELAMFLANIYHESGGLMYKKERKPNAKIISGREKYCGRGYIQLTHDYNYQAASEYFETHPNFPQGDIYKNPELVGEREDIAWAVSAWFWLTQVKYDGEKTSFDDTINKINSRDREDQRVNRKRLYQAIDAVLKEPYDEYRICLVLPPFFFLRFRS